jgi:adenine-specific DNA-methyltransferase
MTADKKTGFNLQHESLLVYARNLDNIFLKGEEKDYKDYKNPDNDPNGEWVSGDPTAKSGNESLRFKIINPYTGQVDLPPKGRYWAFSKETFTKYVEAGKIKFKKEKKENERGFIFKRYKKELKSEHNSVNSLFAIENDYMNQKATKELKEMFDNEFFENPKPVKFIKKLIKYSTSTSDLILDFFSGSATTAHAVMELNAEDGGNRQFILVQLSEPIDEKSEAYKAGYKNICEIGKERIRRAGEKIKEDFKGKEWIDSLDIGFKVFKLDSTNIKEWDSNPDNLEKSLLNYGEFIKKGRSEEDLLYEILLKYGIDLTAPIEEKEINGKKVYIVGFGSLIIYFDEIDIKIAKEIIDLVKNYESDFTVLVLKDDSFATSQDKVNIVEFFKQMNLFEKIITL